MTWADHFSDRAEEYARHRPTYPAALFGWLAEQAPGRRLAWDVATGNGQAALPLAARFDRVVASDASVAQLARAPRSAGPWWLLARAEQAPLAGGSVDLVTVAQALHWLDLPAFYAEARRVARPGGLLAAWLYVLARVCPPVDAILDAFHDEVMGPWWPPRRRHVVSRYQDLPFPFPEVAAPPLLMTCRWTLDRLLDYLGTWSSVMRCRRQTGTDPLPELRSTLLPAWGDPHRERPVAWPLHLRVGRLA
jgi:SAM-dependent methyltransferase